MKHAPLQHPRGGWSPRITAKQFTYLRDERILQLLEALPIEPIPAAEQVVITIYNV